MHCYGCVIGDQQRHAAFKLAANYPFIDPDKKMILVTGHGVKVSVVALKKSATRWRTSPPRTRTSSSLSGGLDPNVREPVNRILGHVKNVILINTQEYLPFVWLMNHAWLILTDSGGIRKKRLRWGNQGSGDARYH
ncbi:UDP-N-acetylglucosamine 2-epimerase [Escherichia coli]